MYVLQQRHIVTDGMPQHMLIARATDHTIVTVARTFPPPLNKLSLVFVIPRPRRPVSAPPTSHCVQFAGFVVSNTVIDSLYLFSYGLNVNRRVPGVSVQLYIVKNWSTTKNLADGKSQCQHLAQDE